MFTESHRIYYYSVQKPRVNSKMQIYVKTDFVFVSDV